MSESCCPTEASVVARLIEASEISAYASVFRLVSWSDRKKPPIKSVAIITTCGVVGPKSP